MGWLLRAAVLAVVLAVAEYQIRWTSNKHRWDAVELPKELEHRYFRNPDGLWIFWRKWNTQRTPKGAVVIAHGYGEHCSRQSYETLAEVLTARGLAVYGMDHQGCGRSGGERVHVEDFDNYARDLRLFVSSRVQPDRARTGAAKTPLFVLGHSMGGAVVARTLQLGETAFKAAIFSGPAFAVDPRAASPPLIAVGKLLHRYLPRLSLSELDTEQITRNRTAMLEYTQDTLNWHGKVPARMGIGLIESQEKIMAAAGQFKTPFLIVHGGSDGLCPVQGSKDFFAKVGTPEKSKTLKIYPGLYHELFEDKDRAAVFNDITTFLDGQM